jgi:catechol 2,3-dioxygenase-like lactoylglutathione lyase family enzyme
MGAVIRYIAFLSERPEEQARFYHRFLGTEEIGRSADGDVAITDGFYNLSFLQIRPGLAEPRMELGLNHIGLEVDDLAEVERRYRAYRPRGPVVREAGGIHRGQLRIHDPDGNPVTLSEMSFGVDGRRQQVPGIRHVAFDAMDTNAMLDFYTEVLGLAELGTSQERRQQGLENRFAGDGFTNLAIHPFYSSNTGHEMRMGMNHIGFLVSDLTGIMNDLGQMTAVAARPANRPFAEVRFTDPDGNRIDLSQTKGWEVAPARWERGS